MKNDETAETPPSASRRTGTRSIALYSMALSVLAVAQVGLRHPKTIHEIPQELADGRPINDAVAARRKTNSTTTRLTTKSESSHSDGAMIPSNTSITKRSRLSIDDHVITQIANGNVSIEAPIAVVVWPLVEKGAKNAVSKHLEENGVNESPFVYLSNSLWNFDSSVVWIGDLGRDSCDKFHTRIREAKAKRFELGLPLQWPVFIIDWTDYSTKKRCDKIEKEMGPGFVKYSQRSIVSGRTFSKSIDWVRHGQRLKDHVLAKYRHMPYFVRTDTIEELSNVLRQQYNLTLASPIERLERSIDVTHFWPLNMKGVKNIHCKLRKKVSQVVSSTGHENNLTTYIDLAGKATKKGRNKVHSAYVETMLMSKIIVVTQRDKWEDHYRLFEAVVSGSMILTDRMLSLPHGLENGTSIVEYDSADDLKSKILYYIRHPDERIEIARKGREVAMKQHRTWHRVEEIIFGKPMSDCSNATRESQCPFLIHANETNSVNRAENETKLKNY